METATLNIRERLVDGYVNIVDDIRIILIVDGSLGNRESLFENTIF